MQAEPTTFRDTPCIRLHSDGASALVALHGAHVLSWIPADGRERLFLSERATFDGQAAIRGGIPLVFPVHPRTAKTIREMGSVPANLLMVEPQPYLEFNYLVKHAKAVITDSGGITEETTVMGVPCMTLRNSTERPETVTQGTNELLGIDPVALRPALDRLFEGNWKTGSVPPLWDGKTSGRIVQALEKLLKD